MTNGQTHGRTDKKKRFVDIASWLNKLKLEPESYGEGLVSFCQGVLLGLCTRVTLTHTVVDERVEMDDKE